ncbi:LysR family transcriptional regulator [Pedococcus sp. P5_B7]
MPRNVDLNLLPALQAILEEQSVTRGAARLGLSQPAMSASLGKLRRHFRDELLTRNGNVYELTPLAQQLIEPTHTAIRAVGRLFANEGEFDPATADREFTVVMSDYATEALAPTVSRLLRAASPASRLHINSITPQIVDTAPDSMRTRDLIVMPHGFLTGLSHRDLYEDDWVCIVSADDESASRQLTMDDLANRPWAVTFHQRTAFTTSVQQLRMQGVEPNVEVVTENYLTLGSLVAGTNRIAVVQERLGRILERKGEVRVLPPPFAADPLVETMWWHPTYDNDAAHKWFRDLFITAGIEIT